MSRLCLIVLPFFWALISYGADTTPPGSSRMHQKGEYLSIDLDALSSASMEELGAVPLEELTQIHGVLRDLYESIPENQANVGLLRIAGLALPLEIGVLGGKYLMGLTGVYLGILCCLPVGLYISSELREHEEEVRQRNEVIRGAYRNVQVAMMRRGGYR